MATPRNDLHTFLINETERLAKEYDRIQSRVGEDPGNAGDQGEENWKQLLEAWLPSEYKIVTRGRILSHSGDASPQIDVLVLHPGYPPSLVDTKLYLSGGVAAAFECKLTLDAGNIATTVENCAKIQHMIPWRTGTPRKELFNPIVYGLLAHSHSWKKPASDPTSNISEQLFEKGKLFALHPRQVLDIVCVADLASWEVRKDAQTNPLTQEMLEQLKIEKRKCRCFAALHPSRQANPTQSSLSPVGHLLLALTKRLAWEDPRLRRMAEYYCNGSA